jgi:hypothetical protein
MSTQKFSPSRPLCLWLQRSGDVRGWGRGGLGTGARRRAEGPAGVDSAHLEEMEWVALAP